MNGSNRFGKKVVGANERTSITKTKHPRKNSTKESGSKASSKGKASQKKVEWTKGTNHGQLATKDSPDGKVGEIFKRHRKRIRAIKQLCLGDRSKLQVRPRQSETKEQAEEREVEKQVRRAVMPRELKEIRRRCLRIVGGIYKIQTGRIEL